MEITVHIILGSIVLILILLYVLRTLFRLTAEGFENINTVVPTGDVTSWCPIGSTLVVQYGKPKSNGSNINAWTCYTDGITNVNNIFQTENESVGIFAPKGKNVKVYSQKDANGSPLLTVSDTITAQICTPGFNCSPLPSKGSPSVNLKFSSIQITGASAPSVPGVAPGVAPAQPQGVTQTCPGLSPVAAAAAAAADATKSINDAKAAAIAQITSKVVADNLAPQISSGDGINITCPSGEKPVVNDKLMRNTKFSETKKPASMFDSTCGKNEYSFDPEMDS